MSDLLTTVPDDVLHLIFGYCDNQSSYRLAVSCKTLYDITASGFAKHISYDYTNGCDVFTFINRLAKHRRSLRTCTIHRLQNPFLWIPIWTPRVNFYQCKITDAIDPQYPVLTEVLIISHYVASAIQINWIKFPLLREIQITNIKVDFTGIEQCKHLSKLCYFPPVLSRKEKTIRRHTINENVITELQMNNVTMIVGY
jgi:hypothetical protein